MAMSTFTRGVARMGAVSASAAMSSVRSAAPVSCRAFSAAAGGPGGEGGEEKGFNPETPQQRVIWLLSLGGVGAATAYFLYRVWQEYYTPDGQTASAEVVLDTPLYKGNPVVFMDLDKDGESLGRLVFQLRKDLVPETVENFRQLFTGECGRSYKGSDFHHILAANYLVGGNIPGPNGERHEAAGGGYLPDERFNLQHTGPGILSSASQMRGENGSLFFITLSKAPNLNGRYVAFGNLMEGLEVLFEAGKGGDAVGNPTSSVTIADCGELRLPQGTEDALPLAPSDRA